MKPNLIAPIVAFLLFQWVATNAQSQYSIPSCGSNSAKRVGEELRLQPPKGAVLKKGRDVDYSDYAIAFGPKNHRTWLEGIFGPSATIGEVPSNWLSGATEITRRTWTFGNASGIDWRGKLPNGNYWRYLGRFGESVKYYDVPTDAARYFDEILDGVCFRPMR